MLSEEAIARYIEENGGRVGRNPILAKAMIEVLTVKRKGKPYEVSGGKIQFEPHPRHVLDAIDKKIAYYTEMRDAPPVPKGGWVYDADSDSYKHTEEE